MVEIYDDICDMKGIVTITSKDRMGNVICQSTHNNAVTNLGKNLILNRLVDNTVIDSISYVAIGIGSAAVDSSDAKLECEVARRTVIYTKSTTGTLEVKFSAYFEADYPSLSNYDISEIALYGGATTADADIGTITTRVLVSPIITKTIGTYSLTVDYKLAW